MTDDEMMSYIYFMKRRVFIPIDTPRGVVSIQQYNEWGDIEWITTFEIQVSIQPWQRSSSTFYQSFSTCNNDDPK